MPRLTQLRDAGDWWSVDAAAAREALLRDRPIEPDGPIALALRRLDANEPPDETLAGLAIASGLRLRTAGERGALAHFQTALAHVLPRAWPAIHIAGELLLSNEVEDAQATLEWLIRHEGPSVSALVHQGICRERLGRLDDACASFRDAAEADPSSPDAPYLLGLCLARLGNEHGSRRALRAAYTAAPQMVHLAVGYAAALRRAGRLQEAIDVLCLQTRREPALVEPSLHLAHTLVECGRAGEALTEAQRLDALNTDAPDVAALVGMMATAAHNWPAAHEAFSRALASEGTHPPSIYEGYARSVLRTGAPLPPALSTMLEAAVRAHPHEVGLRRVTEASVALTTVEQFWRAWTTRPSSDRTPLAPLADIAADTIRTVFLEGPPPAVLGHDEVERARSRGAPLTHPSAFEAAGFQFPDRVEDDRKALASLNQVVAERCVVTGAALALQLSIVRARAVDLPCPFGGKFRSTTSLVLEYDRTQAGKTAGGCVAYFAYTPRPTFVFFYGEDFWPLAWYDPLSETIVHHRSMTGYTAYLIDRVAELKTLIIAEYDLFSRYLSAAAAPRLHVQLIGSLKYISTHYFSDLSGVQSVISAGVAGSIDRMLVTADEVFGPLQELFPELDRTRLERTAIEEIAGINRHLWNSNAFGFRVSGGFSDPRVATRIVDHSKRAIDDEWTRTIDDFVGSHYPVVFVALRAHNRRWLIPGSELARLFEEIAAVYPRLGLLWDGHGTTGDALPDALIDGERALYHGVRRCLSDSVQTVSLIGRTLSEGVYAASRADCHLSAQGTNTTKPFLIANKPGVAVGSQAFWWDARAYRRSPAPCATPWSAALDVGPDLNTDFYLDPRVVRDRLLAMIEESPERKVSEQSL